MTGECFWWSLVCVLTWKAVVGVLVAPVRVAAHGVDARVVLAGRCADEGPVAWDQLIFAQTPAVFLSPAGRLGDGEVAQTIRGARRVRAAMTVAL